MRPEEPKSKNLGVLGGYPLISQPYENGWSGNSGTASIGPDLPHEFILQTIPPLHERNGVGRRCRAEILRHPRNGYSLSTASRS